MASEGIFTVWRGNYTPAGESGAEGQGEGKCQIVNCKWEMASGKLQMAKGKWQMASGKWQIATIKYNGDFFNTRLQTATFAGCFLSLLQGLNAKLRCTWLEIAACAARRSSSSSTN